MATRRELMVGGASALLAGAAAGEAVAQGDIGRAKTEIIAVSKRVIGTESVIRNQLVQCPDGHRTRTMRFRIEAQMTPFDCDEDCSLQFLLGRFDALVDVTRREHNTQKALFRGCFKGQWRLFTPAQVLVASGTMVGTVNAGTHNGELEGKPDCEPCDPRLHFEGVLEGQSRARECRGPICVSIAGQGLDPELSNFFMRAEGAMFIPCHRATNG